VIHRLPAARFFRAPRTPRAPARANGLPPSPRTGALGQAEGGEHPQVHRHDPACDEQRGRGRNERSWRVADFPVCRAPRRRTPVFTHCEPTAASMKAFGNRQGRTAAGHGAHGLAVGWFAFVAGGNGHGPVCPSADEIRPTRRPLPQERRDDTLPSPCPAGLMPGPTRNPVNLWPSPARKPVETRRRGWGPR